MATVVTHRFDAIRTSHDLMASSYIQSEFGLFIGNVLLVPGAENLEVHHLKVDHVPAFLQKHSVTDASIVPVEASVTH